MRIFFSKNYIITNDKNMDIVQNSVIKAKLLTQPNLLIEMAYFDDISELKIVLGKEIHH